MTAVPRGDHLAAEQRAIRSTVRERPPPGLNLQILTRRLPGFRVTEAAARVAGDPAIMACVNADRSGVTSGPAAHEDARRLLIQARACLPGKGEDATRASVLGREAEEAAAIGDKTAKDLIKQAAEAFARARHNTSGHRSGSSTRPG